MPTLLNKQEVADRLRVSPQTVSRYIKAGDLKALKFGRFVRVTDESLSEFCRNIRQAA